MLATSVALGATVLLSVLLLYDWAFASGRLESEARTMAFAAIVCGNVGLILGYRPSLAAPNPALWWLVAAALGALALAIYAPPLAALFRFAPLGMPDLVVAGLAGLAGPAAYLALRGQARRFDARQ
jgi:Ca2+-transporting ATPase